MALPSTAIVRQLTGLSRLVSRGRPSNVMQQDTPYQNGDLSNYFGPGLAVAPIAPPGTDARGWQYWINQNMAFTPRPDAQYTAQQLRELAKYPLQRIAIENAKDIITNLPRQIRAKKRPGEKNAEVDKRSKGDATLKMLNDFFDSPDGEHDWAEWATAWLESVYTIDAPCTLLRRARSGQILQARTDFDGAFITRLVDEWGYTPQPPDAAYQQLWSGTPSTVGGIPFVNLTTDQLLYRPRRIIPRNTVSSFLYGMSATEQNALEIELGQQRLNFWLAYYMTGTIPDAMHIVPPNVSPDQLSQAQKALTAEMSGQPFKRSGFIKMIQGFVDRTQPGASGGDQFIFPKEKLLSDPFDDMHIRKIFYGVGVSAQRILKQMNRASAQAGQEASEEEGTMPVAMSLKRMVDWLIAKPFGMGFGAYEMTYDAPQELDALKRSQADQIDVQAGLYTREEKRVARGDDPNPAPGMGELTITTPSGVVPVTLDDAVGHAKDMAAALPKPQPNGNGDGGPVKKRKAPQLDPARHTPDSRQAQAKLESAVHRLFERQANKAASYAEAHLKKMRKADQSESDRWAQELYDAIAPDFAQLIPEARAALEQAGKAGGADAFLEIEVSDAGMLSSINEQASEYAAKRAAELVGMRYTDAGELSPNPSPKWAITETTRDRLREIVKGAFAKKTPFSELIDDIRNADIFSESRASMIARTEVSNAQIGANYKVWKESGLVRKAKWLAVGPDPCPICESNDGQIRELGKEFPSGVRYPTAHPNCYCILQAVEFGKD